MKFQELLSLVADEPVFDSALLYAGDVQRHAIQRQLARWEHDGRLHQVRRGLYSLAEPYRHVTPHPFLVANRMVNASYVSCQSALAWYGLIPEYTPATTSVTTLRPDTWDSAFGRFIFRHVKVDFLFGYALVEVAQGQSAFVAQPEKALLDLIYLTPAGDAPSFLQELRLQNQDRLDQQQLRRFAERTSSAKLQRAVSRVITTAQALAQEFERL
jgi:predicted transcriptional regulator of viral defense system